MYCCREIKKYIAPGKGFKGVVQPLQPPGVALRAYFAIAMAPVLFAARPGSCTAGSEGNELEEVSAYPEQISIVSLIEFSCFRGAELVHQPPQKEEVK